MGLGLPSVVQGRSLGRGSGGLFSDNFSVILLFCTISIKHCYSPTGRPVQFHILQQLAVILTKNATA